MLFAVVMLPDLTQAGRPTIDGLMTAAIAIASIYWDDEPTALKLANFLNAELLHFSSHPETPTPDFLVIDDEESLFIALAGTTNGAQAFYAVCSAVAITPDNLQGTSRLVNVFWNSMTRRMVDQFEAAHFPKRDRLLIVGHSYGGAACRLGARMIQARGLYRGDEIEALTFGEPKSMDGRHDVFDDFRHTRVVVEADPIQHFPPNIPALATLNRALGLLAKATEKSLNFIWSHHGERWRMDGEGGIFFDPEPIYEIEAYNTPASLLAYLGLPLHQMATGYLPFVLDLYLSGYRG